MHFFQPILNFCDTLFHQLCHRFHQFSDFMNTLFRVIVQPRHHFGTPFSSREFALRDWMNVFIMFHSA